MSDLLPIMEPAYNLREICKQLILLEDHLFHPRKRCLDCIRKHLLTAEALAEEAVTLDVDGSARESTDGLADQIREFWNAVQDVPEEDGSYVEVAQAVRDLRKGLVAQCYGVRVASWLDTVAGGFEPHPNGVCPYRVLVRTAGYFSVGDQIFFGKYKNKRGVILRIFKDERGIPSVEIQPEPQGRKKNRTLGLFNIWHADLAKRAGRVIEFPGGREPPKARKTITIQGEKYALSDDPGDFMRVDEDEGDGDGARLVRGPSPTDPYRFLWVYDTDRRNIHMWRVTDGNEKASGFDSEFRAKIVALDRVGELNRVQTDQLRAIAREMNRRADEQFKSLQQFVDSQKDAYQHLVDEAAREVFEREIVPRIERRLDEIEQGVIPLGFKINDRILEHVDAQRQVRHFVIGQEMERYTTDLIEAEVRRRGADPDAPGHDIQAAYWALHDVQAQAWERFDPQASRRASKHQDRIPGGLADKKKPSDFDAEQLAKGTKVEKEHVDDKALAREIAMDHLTEDPRYYDKLETIEKDAVAEAAWGQLASKVAGTWGYEPWSGDGPLDMEANALDQVEAEPAYEALRNDLREFRGRDPDYWLGDGWAWVGAVYCVSADLKGVPEDLARTALAFLEAMPAHPGYEAYVQDWRDPEAFVEARRLYMGHLARQINNPLNGRVHLPKTEIPVLRRRNGDESVLVAAAKYKNKKKVKTEDGDEATVYEYSEKQVEHRNREKANRVEALRKSIGDLRKQVKKDLDSKDPTTRLTALAVALIDETFERVGNDESAKDGHFGVTGWKVEHITFGDGKATLKYVGKSGVDQEKTVTDSKVVKALKAAVKGKKDSDEILCEGEDCRITATEVNKYLKPFDVTAKDIRGLHANETMRAELKKARKGALPKDKKEREKQLKEEFKEALEATAEAVGHEASTLRSQYLVPGLEDAFLKDGTVLDTLKKESKTATKSESEKEDEQAEHLIRPSPKVKPPRKDLHNNTIDSDDADPDEKQDDKDTSKNFKHQAAVEVLWDRLARQLRAGQPTDKQPRKPGETWETAKGTWSAKSKDGDTRGGFEDEAAAKAWLSNQDEEDEEDAEGTDTPQDDKSDEKALAQAVDAAESAAKKIVGGKHLPEDFRDSLQTRMQAMSDEDRAAFGQAFAETLADLQENQGDEDLEAARKFLQANPDAKDSEGKAKHSADKVGRMVAEALYADRVVFNPFMIGGKVNDDVEAASQADLKEGQEARMERARAAKAAYAKYTPEEVASLVEKLGAGPPPRSELDPDSPRARDIDAIYYGMSLAAMLKDKEPPDLSSAGWKEAKGVSAVRPSAHMNHLAQAMSRVGKEDLLLGTVEDFTAPESQAAVRSAFGSMPDKEIHEFVKGGPLAPLAEAMVARDKNGKFVLSEADRKQFRQMIEDSLVEDIALLDPLVGDYLDAKGKKNTQAARKKFVDEKRQEALEKNKDLHKAVKSWIKDSGTDNEDRASTDEFKALLEAAGSGSRNAVIDAVLEDAEDLNSDNAAIARAVREENSTAAMEVRRVRNIADEQRPPGAVWDKGGEFFAKTPDGSVVGPFKNKDRANEWASGEVSEMRMTAGSYAFTVWPQRIRSSD